MLVDDLLEAIEARLERAQQQKGFCADFKSAGPLEKLGISPREAEILLWVAQGKSNAIMREDTAAGPAGVAAQLFPFTLLSMDEDIANEIERDWCAPKVTIPAGTLRGQTEPCLTNTNPGFELIVNKDLPDEVLSAGETPRHHWMKPQVHGNCCGLNLISIEFSSPTRPSSFKARTRS